MNMQDNLIAIVAAVTAAVVLLAIFISTVDTYYQQSQLDSINVEQDAFDLDPICNPCPNNSDFYHIGVLKGSQNISNTYMFVNLVDFASNLCCNIIGKPESEVVLSDIRVNYCRNIIKYLDNGFIIEILSFAHINSLVGVENISDGYNLSLQVRGEGDKSHYQIFLEYEKNENNEKFALAFMPINTTNKYYVLPQWKEDMALLTIHENPHDKDIYVFTFIPTEGTVPT